MTDPDDDSLPPVPSIALPEARGAFSSWWVCSTLLLCSPAFIALAAFALGRLLTPNGPQGLLMALIAVAYICALAALPCWLAAMVVAIVGSTRATVPGSGKAVMWAAIGLSVLCFLALA